MHPLLHRIFTDPSLPQSGSALDIGCGTGKNSFALAKHNFDVTAVDSNPKNIKAVEKERDPKIKTLLGDVENLLPKLGTFDIILANNIFPFLETREQVFNVITQLTNKMKNNGVFVFSLFGPNDAWAEKENMNFISYENALSFLKTLPTEMYYSSTEEGYGPMMNKEIKYWHIHRFILKK